LKLFILILLQSSAAYLINRFCAERQSSKIKQHKFLKTLTVLGR